jgi:superfamily II DNA/RNA helicase
MHLKEELLRGIYANGLEKPTDIQARSIVAMSSGRDVIAQALPGAGATTSILIGMLQNIDEKVVKCQAMLFVPNRELAHHIHKNVLGLGDYMHIKAHALVGGTAIRDDVQHLHDGVHVVVGTPGSSISFLFVVSSPMSHCIVGVVCVFVCLSVCLPVCQSGVDSTSINFKRHSNSLTCYISCTCSVCLVDFCTLQTIQHPTPGRILDMISRSVLQLDQLKLCVLDEADNMLSHSLKDQINDIFPSLPRNAQVCLVAHAMSPEINQLRVFFVLFFCPLRIFASSSLVM